GNRVAAGDTGLLTDRTLSPVLYRQGKAEIIDREIGRRPALVFGDSMTDFEMMCQATQLAVLIDCGSDALRTRARQKGWAIQPQGVLTCTSELRCR
ncbi:MAG: hypothetical protein ACOC9W_04455, partial [Persicimonas sp.]